MHTCKICGNNFGRAIYVSPGEISLTSLCQVVTRKTEVYFCDRCGHLQTRELNHLQEYYDHDFKILLNSEEEDALYEVSNGKQVFLSDHELRVFVEKANPPRGARILDYGCAKSKVLKLLSEQRPDIVPYLFDVSEMYLPFWQQFAQPDNWATYKPKPEWQDTFDVVTSFFAFEHVPDPRAELRTISALLKKQGLLYLIVPNVYANTADFVVADHIHHYSPNSLQWLLNAEGFSSIEIDEGAHAGAIVVTARKANNPAAGMEKETDNDVKGLSQRVRQMSTFWTTFAEKVQRFEREHSGINSAIYGSGFYGTFIATCLKELGKIGCFIDRNPFRQGTSLQGIPVIAPENLPSDIQAVYVGLNPLSARQEIDKVESWRSKSLRYFYP